MHGRETASGMGLRQPRLGASTKVLRRCIGAKGSLMVAKETDEEMWKSTRRGCGEDDRATVIEGVRVEQVHEAHEVAVAGRHGGHEET
jgi:hypothetical protein